MADLDRILGDIAASADARRGLAPASEVRRRAGVRRRRRAVATSVASVAAVVGAFVAVRSTVAPSHPVLPASASGSAQTQDGSLYVGGDIHANYVDFVRLNGTSYISAAQFVGNASLIGARLGAVRRASAGEPAAGEADAAFLPVGTEIVTFTGYRPNFRVLAHTPQGWKVYETETTDSGKTGVDTLDIAGRVTRIDVLSYASRGSQVLGSIRDAAAVGAVVDAVEASPLVNDTGAPTAVVAFVMTDGTRVIRAYNADKHQLGGLAVPASVSAALDAASH